MFKKLLLAVIVALPMSAMAQKFGVVDIATVFQNMPEAAEMQKEIQETSKQFEDEFQKLQEEVNKLYTEYQTIQNDPNVAETIKESRVQTIQEKMQKVDQFRNTASQELNRLSEQKSAPIQAKINDAIKAVGAEGGYTFILPKDEGLILYSGADVVDLTKAVQDKIASIKPAAAAAAAK